MKKRIFFYMIFIFYSFTFFALDNTGDSWREKSRKFRLESVAKDLLYADINQLKATANTLGLPDEQDASAYRNVLAKYYKIKLLDKKSKDTVNKIILKRAGELKFEKNEKEGYELMHILGRVVLVLEMKDDKNKTSIKTLEANEIFFNTKNKEISGSGNVYFKDDRLEYIGEQFYFNYEINRGVLIKGKTKLLKGGDSGLDDAYFTGEKVVQTDKNDIILYNGKLTTCEEDDPHYFLKVDRLWVSQDSEWGLLNGAFYVGQIPFFYMPFFYHPKELIINPAFGFRSRDGWYFNTTYYVFGKKFETEEEAPKSGATISIKQLVDKMRDENPSAEEVFTITKTDASAKLNDFYNKYDFYSKYPQFKLYPRFQSLDMGLRLFADSYTNLGFYTGVNFYINVVFPNNPFKINVLSDFAFSRKIWKDTKTDLYLPYNPDDRFNYSSKSTYYYMQNNPFLYRTSQWVKMKGSFLKNLTNFNYEGQLEYVSDKIYFKDFYRRKLGFTYIDLLADTISYGIMSRGKELSSSFKPKEDSDATSDYDQINSYFKTNFSLKEYPNVFGLNLFSRFNIDARADIILKDTLIYKIDAEDNNAENPKRTRYLLDEFKAPNSNDEMTKLEIGGTFVDVDAFLNMPEKISVYQNSMKNKKNEKIKNSKEEDDLYVYIKSMKTRDATTDKTELDYMLLLPIFSKKIPSAKIIKLKKDYKYDYLLFQNIENIYLPKPEENAVVQGGGLEESNPLAGYITISKTEPYINKTVNDVKLISFAINYNLKEKYGNTFIFDRTTDNNLDTVENVLSGKFEPNKILQKFHITNDFNYSLENPLTFLKFSDNGVFSLKPKITLSYVKQFDNLYLYDAYLERKYQLDKNPEQMTNEAINNLVYDLAKANRSNSEFKINYIDSIINDLSFGVYRIKGTQIKTDMEFDLFTYNEGKQYGFIKLNQANVLDHNYEHVDPDYYDNRRGYDKVKKLETTVTFQVNLLPETSPHYLNMSLGPKFNWIIPTSELDLLKNELWNEESAGIIYNSNIELSARDYIYYRSEGKNLTSKINGYFSESNFWSGPKYFRKMFDNISYSVNYGYKYGLTEVVKISETFIFKLNNFGSFANQYKGIDEFTVYPNNVFSISFFNSCVSYTNNITFTPEIYSVLLPTIEQQKLDEFRMMVMSNKHTFAFKIPGQMFDVKLPSGDWLSCSTTLDFKWDRRVSWEDGSENNYFFLNSQNITLNLLMDIFKLTIDFQKYNYKGAGYGFELNQGAIEVGHKITEIPVFLRFFKLELEPRISYVFYVKHNEYYDEYNILREFNQEYYKYNILKFTFNVNLTIGKLTPFETIISFGFVSQNKRMQDYYGGPVKRGHWSEEKYGLEAMFQDLADSFNFSNTTARRNSPFDMQSITFGLTHLLCDWKLSFTYEGKPEKLINTVTGVDTGKYNWENKFTFEVTWQLKAKNQLMKMLNKTKIKDTYEHGEWAQPAISLDPNAEEEANLKTIK